MSDSSIGDGNVGGSIEDSVECAATLATLLSFLVRGQCKFVEWRWARGAGGSSDVV